jgi:hypothetical protein
VCCVVITLINIVRGIGRVRNFRRYHVTPPIRAVAHSCLVLKSSDHTHKAGNREKMKKKRKS